MLVQKLKSKVYDYRKFLLVGGALLLLLAAAGVYFSTTNQDSKKQADTICKTSTINSEQLLKQKKYDDLKKKLESSQKDCNSLPVDAIKTTKNPADLKGYLNLLVYKANLARATYMNGDKKQAAVYAEEALKINKEIFGNHDVTLPEHRQVFYDMIDIQAGYYKPRDAQGMPL